MDDSKSISFRQCELREKIITNFGIYEYLSDIVYENSGIFKKYMNDE